MKTTMTMNDLDKRLAGVMLGASVFLMLAHIVADIALGHGRVSVVLILLYGFSTSLAGSALYIAFRRHSPTLALFSGSCFAGHGLLVVLTAAVLLVGHQYPEEFVLFGALPGSPGGTASSLELAMDKIGKSAFAFLGLGSTIVGLLILLTSVSPRWIGWLGFAMGLSGFLASLAGLTEIFVNTTTDFLTGASGLTGLGFLLILGLYLIIGEIQEAPENRCFNKP